MFNSLLVAIDGTFFIICMTASINIKKVLDGTINANSSFGFSFLGLIVCYTELLCTAGFLKFNYANLDDEKKKKRCGYMYEGLKYAKKGGIALIYPLIY